MSGGSCSRTSPEAMQMLVQRQFICRFTYYPVKENSEHISVYDQETVSE